MKRELFTSLREVLGGDRARLATTTSSLNISGWPAQAGTPAVFFGLHVFNPVTKMDLVVLCFPAEAGPDLRARATAFCEALGKTAVEVPDEPGFVVNRLLFPYLFDAVRLLERAGMEPDADRRVHELGASHPMGPLRPAGPRRRRRRRSDRRGAVRGHGRAGAPAAGPRQATGRRRPARPQIRPGFYRY